MMKKNILLPLEGTRAEAPVIRQAIDMARYLNTGLTVLHVNSPRAGRISMMMDREPLVTEADIRNLFRELGYGCEAEAIEVKLVTSSTVSKHIARASEEAMMVILGRSRRSRLASALTETIDKNMPDRVACPVMYVAKAAAEEEEAVR